VTTLIAVYNSDGCVGRCDARCHDATLPDCDCICGGRNHGVGRRQAAQNTARMAEHMIREYTDRIGISDYSAKIAGELVSQLELAL